MSLLRAISKIPLQQPLRQAATAVLPSSGAIAPHRFFHVSACSAINVPFKHMQEATEEDAKERLEKLKKLGKGTPFSEEWFESLTPAALATEYEEIPSVESQTERRYIGPHDYYPVEDPLLKNKLFNIDALRFHTVMTLTHPSHARPHDRKCAMWAKVSKLGLSEHAPQYVRALCHSTGRYWPNTDEVKLVSRKFPTSQQNKRAVLELLQAICVEAEHLAQENGPLDMKFPVRPVNKKLRKKLKKFGRNERKRQRHGLERWFN